MSAKDGGAAFPSPGVVLISGHQQGAYEGMSLRDWFAGQALAGIRTRKAQGDVFASNAASAAYADADAMLKERAK